MSATVIEFAAAFKSLTDHSPLRWQYRLFDRLCSDAEIPCACDLPTGLGKTSVIPIWLIALARQALDDRISLPRRLIYIVNRRTVVDQATSVVERIRQRLFAPYDSSCSQHEVALQSLASALRRVSPEPPDNLLLAVSTLRGEWADNEEWKSDPARPAIIIGTIDMTGSKLLFSGYGDGRYHRAHHACLIGQDALIVHDEAHLTPAFSDLLHGVASAQRQAGEVRPVSVMELSATQRNGDGDGEVLQLEAEDEKDPIVVERLDAAKHLRFHAVAEKDFIPTLVEHAKAHAETSCKVLIYVRSPEHAQEVVERLKRSLGSGADNRVALLAGTIRGYERDRLVNEDPVYKVLLDSDSPALGTVYLVSTSAGEVGIDLDADHVVCDLTTLDSMIQRLGRVNRRGGRGRAACVDVVWAEKKAKPGDKASPIDKAIAATLAALQRWTEESGGKIDASPRNLRALLEELGDHERTAAFSPKPTTPALTDILLDAWSLTSVDKMPGRPEVAAYLHGLTHEPPETYVVWRKEIKALEQAAPSEDLPPHEYRKAKAVFENNLADWFRACRIKARERLRDRTDRKTGGVRKHLQGLLKAHRKNKPDRDFQVALLDERGRVEWSRLSKIVERDFNLAYRTAILPVEVGGLDEHGMLDPKAVEPIDDIDVAEAGGEGSRRERWLDGERCEHLPTGKTGDSLPKNFREHARLTLKEAPEEATDQSGAIDLVLMVMPGELALENPEAAKFEQELGDHTDQIVKHATRISDALWPKPSRDEMRLREALIRAAEWHDRGKDRSVWQRYACNSNGTEALAKSTRYLHGRALGGYRHEFGSLLEAVADKGLRDHSERELIVHLIAAHHGHARPHFDPRAFDHERFGTQGNEEAATEVMRRFGQLQHRFGRWGLAWLESLLRCADIAASQPTADSISAPQSPEVES